MNEPTADDLSRDLAADLRDVETVADVVDHGQRADRLVRIIKRVAPAAIRRALAAEAEVKRLRGIIGGLSDRVAAQAELLSKKAERENP